jgi:hypothetical protein
VGVRERESRTDKIKLVYTHTHTHTLKTDIPATTRTTRWNHNNDTTNIHTDIHTQKENERERGGETYIDGLEVEDGTAEVDVGKGEWTDKVGQPDSVELHLHLAVHESAKAFVGQHVVKVPSEHMVQPHTALGTWMGDGGDSRECTGKIGEWETHGALQLQDPCVAWLARLWAKHTQAQREIQLLLLLALLLLLLLLALGPARGGGGGREGDRVGGVFVVLGELVLFCDLGGEGGHTHEHHLPFLVPHLEGPVHHHTSWTLRLVGVSV